MILNLLFILILIARIIASAYIVESIICRPPNEFVQIFAPPGTGKTTLAATKVRNFVRNEILSKATKENKKVYSNVPVIGAIKFDIKDLGKKDFRDCILIIDEAGSEVGNRNWHSNLDDDQIRFLKKHRHYNVDIYLFSQAYGDVDNKFRELTTKLYMLKKSRIPFMIKACAIRKTMDLINGQIVQFFEWSPRESFRFFNANLWAYFNSYDEGKPLPKMEEIRWIKSETV